jgi:hypothetical protein
MTTTLSASMMILAWGSLLGLGLRHTLACRLGRSLTLLQTFKAMHPITETVYVTNFRPHLQMRLRSICACSVYFAAQTAKQVDRACACMCI